MADRLTEAERAAIAAYDGPVERVAPGATGMEYGVSWRDGDRGMAWRILMRRRRFRSAELQAEVLALWRQGLSVPRISRAVGLAPSTVEERLRRAGVAPEGRIAGAAPEGRGAGATPEGRGAGAAPVGGKGAA